jgi:hypothetical protein
MIKTLKKLSTILGRDVPRESPTRFQKEIQDHHSNLQTHLEANQGGAVCGRPRRRTGTRPAAQNGDDGEEAQDDDDLWRPAVQDGDDLWRRRTMSMGKRRRTTSMGGGGRAEGAARGLR